MHWREIASKEKFKDEGPPADAYIENALFKKLSQHPSECQLIPEGALVLVGMILLWRDSRLYPSFQRFDNASLGGTKKRSRIKITGKKSATIEATTSPVAVSVPASPEGVVVTFAPSIVSPRPAHKRRRTITSLSTFQATKTT
ncbi:hypothetical protein Hanom_Chr05g00416031 [Helianthus anomalus]